ncbi:MmyB family transcriptional regulator [Streptomyces sp. JW3]|uniref:MmyB family transcriptional regulator n=1 Tax=Streptomyces sp. JW3 TaxID=3456955 RepID=UPI003FA4672A
MRCGWEETETIRPVTPAARRIYPAADHPRHSRFYTAQLRQAAARHGPGSPAAELVRRLLAGSEEFTAVWNEHQVDVGFSEEKRVLHPEVGRLTLHCQTLLDPDQEHALLVFTATPGTESYDKLQLLRVVGTQRLAD